MFRQFNIIKVDMKTNYNKIDKTERFESAKNTIKLDEKVICVVKVQLQFVLIL